MNETRARSIAKALSWQAIGFLAMLFLGYLFTGSLSLGGRLAIASMSLGLLTYVLHERVWTHVRWGTGNPSAERADDPRGAIPTDQ